VFLPGIILLDKKGPAVFTCFLMGVNGLLNARYPIKKRSGWERSAATGVLPIILNLNQKGGNSS